AAFYETLPPENPLAHALHQVASSLVFLNQAHAVDFSTCLYVQVLSQLKPAGVDTAQFIAIMEQF
ncbi:MAG: hypothetical protein JW709_09075, partial [Sedimentisphaerales bacterium]|nr:hypothetical protein [Sedimentisphaerales bacterium]